MRLELVAMLYSIRVCLSTAARRFRWVCRVRAWTETENREFGCIEPTSRNFGKSKITPIVAKICYPCRTLLLILLSIAFECIARKQDEQGPTAELVRGMEDQS